MDAMEKMEARAAYIIAFEEFLEKAKRLAIARRDAVFCEPAFPGLEIQETERFINDELREAGRVLHRYGYTQGKESLAGSLAFLRQELTYRYADFAEVGMTLIEAIGEVFPEIEKELEATAAVVPNPVDGIEAFQEFVERFTDTYSVTNRLFSLLNGLASVEVAGEYTDDADRWNFFNEKVKGFRNATELMSPFDLETNFNFYKQQINVDV